MSDELLTARDKGIPHRAIGMTASAFLATGALGFGLSHPCTAFDKWRVLPVVDSIESGVVVDLIRTWF